jgi:lipopolysaccharide export system permease protein
MRSLVTAARGTYGGNNTWRLTDVTETMFTNSRELPAPGSAVPEGQTIQSTYGQETAAIATRKLAENKQETERFKVAFWKKVIDPFSIFVLMALALPFAYLHTRSGGVSLKIFIGIMIGVSFLLINSLFSHLGVLTILPAFFTALAPSLLFLLMALGALWWVERH